MIRMRLSKAAFAALSAALLGGCAVTPPPNHYVEPTEGKTALMRVGGEGMIAVRTVTKDDADFCYTWDGKHNQVLYYLDGITKKAPADLPNQGKSLGLPPSSATARFPDKNRWAEIRIPAGQEIEIQYSLPYERVPGSAPKIKLGPDDDMPQDTGALCRAGFRFVPEPGKQYQANFSWGQNLGRYSCSAIFTSLPDNKIVRVNKLDQCHMIDYDNLLKFDGFNK